MSWTAKQKEEEEEEDEKKKKKNEKRAIKSSLGELLALCHFDGRQLSKWRTASEQAH